jgi:hypothetical protein
MKKLTIIYLTLIMSSCFSGPQFIPDERNDSPMTYAIKKGIDSGQSGNSYGWIFWYAPIATIAFLWAYREFITKRSSKNEQ